MTYTIQKTWEFAASHSLDRLGPAHKCYRLHGHNYRVRLTLTADEVDQWTGILIDYGELGRTFGQWVDSVLDHRHLNDVLGPDVQPSAENLAKWIWGRIMANNWTWVDFLTLVEVKESDGTTASYTDDGADR